jgi:hypothetical protein
MKSSKSKGKNADVKGQKSVEKKSNESKSKVKAV